MVINYLGSKKLKKNLKEEMRNINNFECNIYKQ